MSTRPLLEVDDLRVTYVDRGAGFLGRASAVHALDGVSFRVERGEVLAIVGSSGAGKTTLARAVLRLVEPGAGRVLYRRDPDSSALDLLALDHRALRAVRPDLQIVFQDPQASLNPRMTAGDVLREGGGVRGRARALEIESKVHALMDQVGLSRKLIGRRPHELSGGERQRLCLARALSTSPRCVVLDEALSSLDVSIQAQVLNLLADLRAELGIAWLFIAHDLSLVRYLADRVAVMEKGKIVETGAAEEVFARPVHAATKALLAAMPSAVRRD